MRYSFWFVATLLVGLNSGALPAWANPSMELDSATSLSMSDVLVSDPPSAAHLNRLADHMNRRISSPDDAPAALDSLELPFLDDLLDEDGNLQLPMGLIIYNTMGDTSIGFGSKF